MNDVTKWWSTEIIDMKPGSINLRGKPIQDLIGKKSFVEMIWFMTTGEEIDSNKLFLLEAALVSSVDHGPQAPSISAARMSATCGVDINNSLATGINLLGDIHGGAGQQALELYTDIQTKGLENLSQIINDYKKFKNVYIPGFGHRFHKSNDPRTIRLLEIVDDAIERKIIKGEYAKIARKIEQELSKKKNIPMNIDGITAVIYAELGCPAALSRGLFCLSRSVGILSHTWEQMQQGERIKGPTPPDYKWDYKGK